jgi:hypothetical protein
MPDPLTSAALRRLHEAATEGPWHPERHDDDTLTGYVMDSGGNIVASVELCDRASLADVELVPALRNAAPRLIALLEAAERLRVARAAVLDAQLGGTTKSVSVEFVNAIAAVCDLADPQRGGGG